MTNSKKSKNFNDSSFDSLQNEILLTPPKLLNQTNTNHLEQFLETTAKNKDGNSGQKIVLLQRDYLGNNKDNIDGLLNFFETLIQTELLPSHIILIEDAVKITALNENAIVCLKKFEKLKVEIIVHKESLFKFEIVHKCSVGKVADLASICIILMTKTNVLSI